MGILENQRVAPFASDCQEEIARVANEAGVQVSPFAQDILSLFIVSSLFEPVVGSDALVVSSGGGEVLYGELRNQMRYVITDLIETSFVRDREGEIRNIVISADVYHWISDYGAERLNGLIHCPWAK